MVRFMREEYGFVTGLSGGLLEESGMGRAWNGWNGCVRYPESRERSSIGREEEARQRAEMEGSR
jgi:hypothetical protein